MKPIKKQIDNPQTRGGLNKPSREQDSIAVRAKRVDWQKVDDVLARVPAKLPIPGDEVD